MSTKWYAVHVNTGFEDKVKKILEDTLALGKVDVGIEEVLLPTEKIIETQASGKKRTSTRRFFPGYILVKMELDEETWHFIKSIPKVIGFVGDNVVDGRINSGSVPDIDEAEIASIKTHIKEGTLKPKPKIAFEIGETVKVTEGPFASFSGTIEDIDPDKGRVQVSVTIFGRTTPIELDFGQVEKV